MDNRYGVDCFTNHYQEIIPVYEVGEAVYMVNGCKGSSDMSLG